MKKNSKNSKQSKLLRRLGNDLVSLHRHKVTKEQAEKQYNVNPGVWWFARGKNVNGKSARSLNKALENLIEEAIISILRDHREKHSKDND